MRLFREITVIFLLLTVTVSTARTNPASDSKPDRYILIHLDAVSSFYLESEMQAGNLPNLQETFRRGSGGIIEKAITYFPSKTPTVISSLRDATSIEDTRLVGWSGSDRMSGEVFTGPTTFWRMMLSKPRISVTNFLYGIPVLDRLAGPALTNIPDLLDDYRVLEFYWYPVDTYGHFYGEEFYLKKLRVFDKHFGKLMKRVDEDVNVVIYSDHGMTFGEGINTHGEISDLLGDLAEAISYPNLYLHDPEKIAEAARMVVDSTSIDFTFFRSSDSTVTGFHANGTVFFHLEDGGLRYSYEGEDPFRFFEKGYDGESLTAGRWLELTYDLDYPAAPVQVFSLLSNPGSGDILTLLDETKFSQSAYSKAGNHGGFTSLDLTIPIMLKGPDLEPLYDRQTLWLQNLFLEISNVDFGYTPSRDNHYLNGWYNVRNHRNTMQLSISPAYRWAVGGKATFAEPVEIDRYQAWGKFDLLRSYLARLWIGAGVDINNENSRTRPMVFIRHELRYRRVTARSSLSTAGDHYFGLEFRIADPVSIQVINFNSAGLRLHF